MTPVHNFKPLSLEQVLKDVNFDKITKEVEKKKRVYDLNLESIDFSTPPPESEDIKTARMHRDDISRISNAPAVSTFEKPKV